MIRSALRPAGWLAVACVALAFVPTALAAGGSTTHSVCRDLPPPACATANVSSTVLSCVTLPSGDLECEVKHVLSLQLTGIAACGAAWVDPSPVLGMCSVLPTAHAQAPWRAIHVVPSGGAVVTMLAHVCIDEVVGGAKCESFPHSFAIFPAPK